MFDDNYEDEFVQSTPMVKEEIKPVVKYHLPTTKKPLITLKVLGGAKSTFKL